MLRLSGSHSKGRKKALIQQGEEDSKQSSTLNSKIQDCLCGLFNEILEVQIFTPLLYSILLLVSFIQQLYFILYELQFINDQTHQPQSSFNIFLRYLPIFPEIMREQTAILYILMFILLFVLIISFFILIVFYAWLEERRKSQNTKQGNGIKAQMSSNLKILLKVASVYLVIHKEFLIVPSFVFIFDILKCGDNQLNAIATASNIHGSTGIECWSSFYFILFIIGVFHFVLLVLFEALKLIYMNDAYLETDIPWTQFTLKPIFLNFMINIGYSLIIILDANGQKKYIMDIVCLLLSLGILLCRLMFPIFQSEVVKKVTIIIEVTRMWIAFVVVMHGFFNVSVNPFSIILEIVICFFLVILFHNLIGFCLERTFMKGMNGIKNQNSFEVYLHHVTNLINQDSKRNAFTLQGAFQCHVQECSDPLCPCDEKNNEFKVTEQAEDGHSQKIGKNFNINSIKGQQFQNGAQYQRSEFYRTFIEKFELRKASLVTQKSKQQQYQSVEFDYEESSQKSFMAQHWYNFLKYELRKKLLTLKMTVKLHSIIASFYFLKIKNEFQALFELIVAEEKNPRLNLKFIIYRLKKRIEKVIFQKHEKSTSMNRKINIMQVFEYERSYSVFQRLIVKNTLYSIKFWNELLEKDLNAVKINDLGIKISKNNKVINDVATKLTRIYPNQLKMLLTYARYLNDVINNEYNAADQFQKAINQRINFRANLKINENNEEMLFGENAFCSIFVLNTENKKLGIIEFVNQEVQNQLGYSQQDLLGRDINTLIPKMIAVVHANLLSKFFDKAESSVLNKVRELFAKDKDGFLVPIYLFSKVLPSLTNGLKLIGVIKKIQYLTFQPEVPPELQKMTQEYIICDKDNNIQNFTYGLTLEFGLFPKMFQNVNGNSLFDQEISIDYLSHEFSDKANDLQQTGAIITINTNRLFQKVEREVLTNEEFNFFLQKQGQIKIFCQMAQFNFSNLVEVKIYRIIQVEKMASNQKHDSNSISESDSPDGKLFDSGFNPSSGSGTIGSTNSSILSLDRQLKDFKKQITENTEPKQVSIIRNTVKFILLFIIATSSLIYNYQIVDTQDCNNIILDTLSQLHFQSKFVQLQLNVRTLLDIANNVEYGYNNLTYLPYPDRVGYLNQMCSAEVEDIRNYMKFKQEFNENITMVDMNYLGVIYSYDEQVKLAFDQYVIKAIDLINRNISLLKTSIVYANNFTNIQYADSTVATSAYFVLNDGYTLLDILYNNIRSTLSDLTTFQSSSFQYVQWFAFISIVVIVTGKILLIIVIQIIENNKVIVLSLYSEIKVSHVRDSINKSRAFHNYLLNVKEDKLPIMNEILSIEDVSSQDNKNTSTNEFLGQWKKFNDRLNYFRNQDQKSSLDKLKKLLIRQSAKEPMKVRIISDHHEQEDHQSEVENQSPQMQQEPLPFNEYQNKDSQGLKPISFDSNHNQNALQVTRLKKNIEKKQSLSVGKSKRITQKQLVQRFKHQRQELSVSVDDEESKEEDDEEEKEEHIVKKNDNIVGDEEKRIGKHEQFSKIKKRNWKQVIILIVMTLVILTYFAFSYFFLQSINIKTQAIATHVKLGYYRYQYVNLIYGYVRRRIVSIKPQLEVNEAEMLQQFYDNEDEISRNIISHPQEVDFLYSFLSQQDSPQFCNILNSQFNDTECSTFQDGILKQGYKQSLFSFIKFYTQVNITVAQGNHTLNLQLLNTNQIQSFYIAAEAYYSKVNDLLTTQWKENLDEQYSSYNSTLRATFIIFIFLFIFFEGIIIPKIIQQLNETTWRSRGILNLVPNEVIKELRQNSKILQLFKS